MTRPAVSILIPVYNAGRYLRECLESVVTQTYQPLEVVIVNDGSTDNSGEICADFAERYAFVKYIHKENGGVASARNMLLDHAKGDYSLFVDADDWIDRDMVEALVAMIQNYNLDVAICGNYKEENGKTYFDHYTGAVEVLSQAEAIEQFIIHKKLNGSLCNKLIKTSLFGEHRFPADISYGEDALMMWNVLQNVNQIGIIDRPFYHYRMNDASISHQMFGSKKMSGHKVWEQIASDTRRLWPQYTCQAEVSFAVSDMWLLFYAAQSGYKRDAKIRKYQRHVSRELLKIGSSGQVNAKKFVFALIACSSFSLAKYVVKRFY